MLARLEKCDKTIPEDENRGQPACPAFPLYRLGAPGMREPRGQGKTDFTCQEIPLRLLIASYSFVLIRVIRGQASRTANNANQRE
jgi:hypothetical protein